MNNFKPTALHYNLKNWVESLEYHINRCLSLIDNHPDDPRTVNTIKELNIYDVLRNFMTGSDHCTPTPENYDYMVQCYRESQQLKKKNFSKGLNPKRVEPESEVIAQTQVTVAPELISETVDTLIMEEQLHYSNVNEGARVGKKKSKKVKTN